MDIKTPFNILITVTINMKMMMSIIITIDKYIVTENTTSLVIGSYKKYRKRIEMFLDLKVQQ